MSTYIKRCCVPGCNDSVSTRHRFPIKSEDVSNIWLQRIGSSEMLMYNKTQLYNTCFVCSAHFIKECVNGKRLARKSLPTINMPGYAGGSTVETSFWQDPKDSAQEYAGRTARAMELVYPETPNADVNSICPKPSTSTASIASSAVICTKRKRTNLLRMINVTRQNHLTPKEALLYKAASSFVHKSYILSKKLLSVQSRLKAAKQVSETRMYDKINSDISSTIFDFLLSQMRNYKLKPRGRRFTLDNKILALSLYKASPRGYRLLEKLFALPSRRTLGNLLKRVPFTAGINENIFSHLKSIAYSLPEQEKYCSIIFDEMSLQALLSYDKNKDFIDGFEYNGDTKNLKLADHALVFMAQGVYRPWKQPLLYTFCEAATKSMQLAALIKTVTTKIISAGLIPVATICDQASQNQAAINLLVDETRKIYINKKEECRIFGFEIDGVEIVPMYDYPHLLKCMRNQFLTKDVLFTKNGIERQGSWKHVISLYEMDVERNGIRVCPKLTDSHVYAKKMQKMKVKHCTQTLSRSVGTLMGFLAENGLPPLQDAVGTSEIIIFLDTLFDSVNGVSTHSTSNNELRCRITPSSGHLRFWLEAKELLRTTKFQCPTTKKVSRPPTIKNWIHTIQAFEYLWQKFQSKGFRYLIPKYFNQDAIENFFGMVRSHGIRNINPTCSSFQSSFKTLVLNNFLAARSFGTNCEDNLSNSGLSNFKHFITNDEQSFARTQPILEDMSTAVTEICENELATYAAAYVSGYVARKVLVFTNNCTTCCNNFISDGPLPQHELIKLKQNMRQKLLLPNSKFMILFNKCLNIINTNLPKLCLQNDLSLKLKNILESNINFCGISCRSHPDVKDIFIRTSVNFTIHTWVNEINRILKGSNSRFNPLISSDKLKVIAFNYRLKHK